MRDSEQCSLAGCNESVAALLEERRLCRGHFISVCSTRLEGYAQLHRERRLSETEVELVRRFVHECVRQADRIELGTKGLNDEERKKLIDVLFAAAALGCRLRRSPRSTAAIRIRVQSEGSEQAWEEETETRLISRHGALVGFEHPVEVGERLRVVRVDNGHGAQARVAWYRRKRRGQPEVGLEFTDCENFWEADWDALETNG